jgi:hypothetical protein
MRVTTGTIRHGTVELDDDEVTPEERAKLLDAIAQLERGEYEDGWELLRSIRPK